MVISGALVTTNVLFTMVTHHHFWSGEDVLDKTIVGSSLQSDLHAKRGTIYDRNYNIVAKEAIAYTMVAYTNSKKYKENCVENPQETAKEIKKVLKDNVSEKTIAKILKTAIEDEKDQTELGPGTKRLNRDIKKKLEKKKIKGIDFIKTSEREYPMSPFASSLVGYAAYDEGERKITGKKGLEYVLNRELSGVDGLETYQQTVLGLKLPGTKNVERETDGYDVVLTLDMNLQRVVEKQLKRTMEENNAKKAWALVMEPDTGRILAWGGYPTFNQNTRKGDLNQTDIISLDAMEPGSIMKPFVYATAMDTNTYPYGGMYLANQFKYDLGPGGKIRRLMGNEISPYPPIQDAQGQLHGTITFEEGLKVSSNIAVCELLANHINYGDYEKYLDRFGFFKPIKGIHLSQATGTKNLGIPTDYLSSGFGQASSVTMLQMAQAYTAIFNDGRMMRPYFVESIQGAETGEIIENTKPTIVSKPISEKTSKNLRKMLEQVSQPGGTGYKFAMNGIDMSMKTGTGEIHNADKGGYDTEYYTSSVIAGAPADHPKIMVCWGMVSANYLNYSPEPFQIIMKEALKENGVSGAIHSVPVKEDEESKKDSWEIYEMPAMVNHTMKYCREHLKKMDVQVEVLGDGNTVLEQFPKSGSSVYSNDRIFLITNGKNITMPDMTGWNQKDITIFEKITGTKIKVKGNGKVKLQSLEVGKKIQKNTEIELTLE